MNPNSYNNQKLRGLKRKLEAIEFLGGKCRKCGYNKNISALDFHHRNPKEKFFQLDLRRFSNQSIQKIKNELNKCVLLCANCHREEHHPTLELLNIDNLKNQYSHKKGLKTLVGTECPTCKMRFKNITGKKFCSENCYIKYKNLPSIIDIENLYKKLKSWDKVAKYFNITRRITQTIRKNPNLSTNKLKR